MHPDERSGPVDWIMLGVASVIAAIVLHHLWAEGHLPLWGAS